MKFPKESRPRRTPHRDPSSNASLVRVPCTPDSSKSCCSSSSMEMVGESIATRGAESATRGSCTCERPNPTSQEQQKFQQQQQHKHKHQHRRQQSHKVGRHSQADGIPSQLVGKAGDGGVAARLQRQHEQQTKQQQKQQLLAAFAHRSAPLADSATTREASTASPSSRSAAAAAITTAIATATAASEEAGYAGPERSLQLAPSFEFSCRDFDASSPYVPVALLGRGAVGRVFRCTERSSGDSVAVKVVYKRPLRSRSRLRRQVLIEKEALVALSAGGRSVHPSVVHLRRTYQTAESLYFVLHYAGAASLRDVLRRLSCAGLSLSVGAARLWAAEIAAALAAMRGRGVLHRDIRPENIVVSHEGHLTLVDFDSALCLANPQQQRWQQQKQQQQQQQKQQQHGEGANCHHGQKQHLQREQHSQQKEGAERLMFAPPEFLYPNTSSSSSSSSSSSNLSRTSRNRCESEPGRLRDDLESRSSGDNAVMYPYAGTAAYAPPELFVPLDVEGEAAAQQQFGCGFGTDCWSLGCVVHELLLGEPPFKGHSAPALARAVCGEQELSLPPQLPAAAADLIRGLLRPKEEERLGSKNLRELLEHPFFNGIDCMALHYHPLPIDVMQYAFAFQESGQGGRAAAAAAAAAGVGSATFGGDEADAVAAVSAAVLDAELTPSIGCPFSPLKSAAADSAHVCVCCDSSKTCVCCGGDPDAVPISPGPSLSSSTTQAVSGEAAFHGAPAACQWKRMSIGGCRDGTAVQEQQEHGLQEESDALSVSRSESTEEPRAACRRAVTDAVLGWGPPLRLRPVSSADYTEADGDGPFRAAEGASGGHGSGAGIEGSLRVGSVACSSMPSSEGLQLSGLPSTSFRDAQGIPRGNSTLSQDTPPHVAKCLLKGERMQYHGVLLRMREHRSFCERLFIRLFGKGHKRNCQLQPQRCLAVLTDTGRLLLMDPNGRTLRKTVVLATDGEIYTEGKDMLIYSSVKDNCYLLFASEENTVSVWARFLAVSVDSLRCRGTSGRPLCAACGQRTNTDIHGTPPLQALSRGKFASPPAPRTQDRGPVASPSWDALVGSRGRPSCRASSIEGASVPTAATATGRPWRDRSNTVSHCQKQPPRWQQERIRSRRGSARLASPPSSAQSQKLRRPQSEGPTRRYGSYLYGSYDLRSKV